MRILSLLLIAVLLGSCEDNGKAVLPGKVGPAGELLVVCTERVWNGPVGATIRNVVQKPYPVTPQAEDHYDVLRIDPIQFDKFYKPHRNVLVVDIDDRIDTQEPSFKFYREKYSQDQIYMEAKGKTPKAVADVILERKNEFLSVLNNAEIDRIMLNVRAFDNEALSADLAEKYGFTLDIPRDGQLVQESENFIWIQREMTRMKGGQNHDVKEGFFIYTYPYTTDSVFSMQWLIEKRNEVLRANVRGGNEGSYMTTATALTPRYEEITFKGQFAAEIRGLWEMENDFMGGPFYMLTFYDEAAKQIVTLDGYAYAPYFNKREYIREVEAVLKSFRKVKKATAQPSE